MHCPGALDGNSYNDSVSRNCTCTTAVKNNCVDIYVDLN